MDEAANENLDFTCLHSENVSCVSQNTYSHDAYEYSLKDMLNSAKN